MRIFSRALRLVGVAMLAALLLSGAVTYAFSAGAYAGSRHARATIFVRNVCEPEPAT